MKEDWLREMRQALGANPVTLLPIIEATVVPHIDAQVSGIGSRPTWRLMGMDLIALQNLPHERGRATRHRAGHAAGLLCVSEAMATREGWKPGSVARLIINDEVVQVTIAAVMPEVPDAPAPPDDSPPMDIREAQTLLHRRGPRWTAWRCWHAMALPFRIYARRLARHYQL